MTRTPGARPTRGRRGRAGARSSAGVAIDAHRLLERVEHQVVELLLHLAEAGADVRRAAQAAAELVLAEADVAALVLDDALQHLAR